MSKGKQVVGGAAVEEVLDSTGQIAFLRRRIRDLEADRTQMVERLGNQAEFVEQVSAALVAVDPYPPFRYKAPSRGTPVTAVIKLSDWHIGEVIRAAETESFGRFNLEIGTARLMGVVSDFLKWVEVQRSAYRIDECVALCEGDYISGDIHDELRVTAEFPLPVQTAHAGRLLGEVLRILSGRFRLVRASLVGADNHGRLVRKPQAKQKTTNNMSYLVHALARSYTSRCGNLVYEEADGIKRLVDVQGFRFLSEHGDTVRGWAGNPYYGFSRMMGKEARRRMNTPKGFHYWSIGHFHVPAVIEGNQFVNGSLSGTSEFDHTQGRHAAPSQVGFLVGRHGVFNWVPFTGRH